MAPRQRMPSGSRARQPASALSRHGPRLVRADATGRGTASAPAGPLGQRLPRHHGAPSRSGGRRDGGAGRDADGGLGRRHAVGSRLRPATIEVVADIDGGDRLAGACHLDVIDEFPSPRAFFADLHVHSNDTVGTQDTDWNLRLRPRRRRAGRVRLHRQRLPDHRRGVGRRGLRVPARRVRTASSSATPGSSGAARPASGGDHNVVFLGDDTTLARSLEWHQGMARQSHCAAEHGRSPGSTTPTLTILSPIC